MRVDIIDNFRAMAMMYVIFVHSLFWLNLFSSKNIYPTLFLIEMPLFFIVTGMAHNFANTDNLKKFYVARLKRLLIPYWIFALICAFFSIKYYAGDTPPSDILTQWLNPFGTFPKTLPFLKQALWFVPVYLSVMVFIPLLKKFSQSTNIFIRIAPLLVIVVLLILFQERIFVVEKLTRQVVFYSFWVYVGLLIKDVYKISFSKKLPICIGIALLSFAVMYFFLEHYSYLNFNMQKNKFPPNVVFLFYNLGVLAFVFLFCNQINKFLNKLANLKFFGNIFKTYRDYCYTVFLYHPFAFLIVFNIARYFHIKINDTPVLTVIILYPILITIAALIAKIFARFETIGKKQRSVNAK